MATNSMQMTVTGSIQVSDVTPPAQPFFSRAFSAQGTQLNFSGQIINMSAQFNLPLSGTGNYSLIYVRNLMTANTAQLLVNFNGVFQMGIGPGAFILLGNGASLLPTPITSMFLAAGAPGYPFLAEYALASPDVNL